jgi:tight adherence protein B
VAVLLQVFFVPFFKYVKRIIINRRENQAKLQFKEALLAISGALSSGYSIENSIEQAYEQMKSMYGTDSYICKELGQMINELKVNIPIEKVFANFALGCGFDDAVLFSKVFAIAKRTGGNVNEVVKTTAKSIELKFEVEKDIAVVIASKKYEQLIMCLVPLGIIAYMKMTSPGFLDVMYETYLGKIVMTACLGVYVVAFLLGNKIMDIKV